VLAEIGKGKPMHYKEITRIAIEQGWLIPKGLTPETTLTAQIGTDNRRREARGERPRFVVVGGGFYALSERSETPHAQQSISTAIEEANRLTKEKLKTLLYKMPPIAFEQLIGNLLSEAGYEDVEVTARSNDGGIDVRARLTAGGIADVNAAIQVKRYKANIQAPVVRELRGSLDPDEIGVVITTSDFSSGAKEESRKTGRTPIKLINGHDLVELLVQQSVGVVRRQLEVLELGADLIELVAEKVVQPTESVEPSTEPVEPSIAQATGEQTVLRTKTRRPSIKLPEGLLLRARLKDQKYDAVVIDGKIRYGEQLYSSPSTAAAAATGWVAANGWVFWEYEDPSTNTWLPLTQLREAQE
jgi:hypothetical protein